jgi:hypothetical protein
MIDSSPTALGARVRHLVPLTVRRAAVRVVSARRAARVERQLAALARDPRPIVVGPWLGEVGFELLYWVPFVRWFAGRYGVPPERLIAVTRGGAATWYESIARRSHDALSFLGEEDFRARNQSRQRHLGEQKQVAVTALDDELIALVREREQADVAVLHPSLMYYLFAPYWWGHAPLALVRDYTVFAPLAAPALDIELPADYSAVKFYFNDCFTSTPAHRAFVDRTLAALGRDGAVISLSTGLTLDDHAPCEPDIAAMRGIRHLLSPSTNLLVQSAVVARARRFVGTYGGFAYLAPFYGVPTVSYYTDRGGFSMRHLDLARDVLAGWGRPELLEVSEVPA